VDRLSRFEKARNLNMDRVFVLAHNLNFNPSYALEQARATDPTRQRTTHVLRWHARIRALLDQKNFLYCDLATLEARIKGLAPAVEGIRVVKERRT
jgi:hypothetical protein